MNRANIARFLDTALGYLQDGYRLDREDAFEYDFSSLPLAYQVAEPDESVETLESLAAAVERCHSCPLGKTRTRAVPGEGAVNPTVLVIGEGPGAEEDASGRPFVGPAGRLLDKILASIGLSREENCFIANVVKCRPPGNRDPSPEEIAACASFLDRQISLLNPQAILCAGRVAASALLKTGEGIGRLRGTFYEYQGIPLLATYHPSAVLRDESLKRPVWEDLKLLRDKLG